MSVCVCAGLFGVVLTIGLRGEGRRGWEEDLGYGVKKNYMVTWELIEFVFFYLYHTYIHYLYKGFK